MASTLQISQVPLPAAQTVLTSLIFFLAIRRGVGGVSASDRAVMAIAAAMMVPKTYRDPHSETLSTFVLASLGGALAAGAVGSPELSLLLYPLYFVVVNGALALLIHHRRVQAKCDVAPSVTAVAQRGLAGP